MKINELICHKNRKKIEKIKKMHDPVKMRQNDPDFYRFLDVEASKRKIFKLEEKRMFQDPVYFKQAVPIK